MRNKNGQFIVGFRHTEASKIKMSITRKKLGIKPPSNLGKHHSKETRNKIRIANTGKKHSLETKKKISEFVKNNPPSHSFKKGHKFNFSPWNKGIKWLRMKDESNPRWKGDDVGYCGLHTWIYRKLGRPTTCEHCGKTGLTGRKIHWANKSGKYLRNINDWLRLCVKCHSKYDIYHP
jgi:hypothetical protein